MRDYSWTIQKELRFEASHVLENLPSRHPCANVHGHSYIVTVQLSGDTLDAAGMLLDFNLLKKIRETLDHRHLNDVLPVTPTAENIAKFIMELTNQVILEVDAHDDVVCDVVRVHETHSSWAEYRRNKVAP